MHKYRRLIQLLTVLGCLTWGGYQITSEVLAEPALTTAANAQVTESTRQVEADYPDLPTGVAQAVHSVVATQQLLDGAGQKGVVASGVILNGQQILTAGHNVEQDGRLACSKTVVIAPGLLTDAAASVDLVTHASVRYDKSADLAVLTLRSGDNFQGLPGITMASRTPRAGDTVYFINYQPTADGMVRSPSLESPKDTSKDYSKPVIFAGTVLGYSDNGLAIATGYSKSFGKGAPDNMLRKGASGGAIVNDKGQLIGLSVASASLQADRSAASIMKEYRDVHLTGDKYQVAYMQAVNSTIVESLQSKLVSCASGL